MSEPYFVCQMPIEAFAAASGGLNRWPDSPPEPLRWFNEGGVGKVSAIDVRGMIPFATRDFEAVCGLRFQYTPNAKTANLIIRLH